MSRHFRAMRRTFWPAFFYAVLPAALFLLAVIFWLGPELVTRGFCQ